MSEEYARISDIDLVDLLFLTNTFDVLMEHGGVISTDGRVVYETDAGLQIEMAPDISTTVASWYSIEKCYTPNRVASFVSGTMGLMPYFILSEEGVAALTQSSPIGGDKAGFIVIPPRLQHKLVKSDSDGSITAKTDGKKPLADYQRPDELTLHESYFDENGFLRHEILSIFHALCNRLSILRARFVYEGKWERVDVLQSVADMLHPRVRPVRM